MCESDERKPEQIREDRYRSEAEPAAPSRVVTITPYATPGPRLPGVATCANAPLVRSHFGATNQIPRF
jgi:hypothetical protein